MVRNYHLEKNNYLLFTIIPIPEIKPTNNKPPAIESNLVFPLKSGLSGITWLKIRTAIIKNIIATIKKGRNLKNTLKRYHTLLRRILKLSIVIHSI